MSRPNKLQYRINLGIFLSIILALAACSSGNQQGEIAQTKTAGKSILITAKVVPTISTAGLSTGSLSLPSPFVKSIAQPSTEPSLKSAASPMPASTNKSSPSPTPTAAPLKGVTIAITGDDKLGVILPATLVQIKFEISVLTLLQTVTREHKVQMESSGKGIFAYVKGIASLYEFDRGAKSGWLFTINGVYANKGAGDYMVKAGDFVEWKYTLNLGKDIGAKP